MQFPLMPKLELSEEFLESIKMEPKRSHIKRKPVIPFNDFYETIVFPVMQHVAAKNIKKNMAMTVSALCGCINFLPIHDEYTGTTSPFQTFSSTLTRRMIQPAYKGQAPTKSQSIKPTTSSLENTVIPVYPQLTLEHGVPKRVIDRFVQLCRKYKVNHRLFTETGGEIALTENFLKVISYWASDQGLSEEDQIWGSIKPMRYVPSRWLDEKDLPAYAKKRRLPKK